MCQERSWGKPCQELWLKYKKWTNRATYGISLNQQGTHLTPCPSICICRVLGEQDLTYGWGVFKAERKYEGGYSVDSKLPLPGSVWSHPKERSIPRAAVPRCACSTGLVARLQEGQVSKRCCCAAVKALCPPETSISKADFSTLRQASFWAASSRGAHTAPLQGLAPGF